jgi:D-glycero-D-manno-heptose 1,7-bisphosphate phosphatase
MKISAVFLDRDGVLNAYLPGDYVKTPAEMALIPGAAIAVRRLNDASIPVIVISNQQGVGKGLMTEDDLNTVTASLRASLDTEAGAHIDRCYYCTDLKSANSQRRKPAPGMLLEAAEDFGLALSETIFVGDSPTDIAAGAAAGVGATLLILSGATRAYGDGGMTPAPDHVFADLTAAVDWILETS